jgi:HEAT repeat protein
VSKIGSGQLDPMRLAKSELAAMGEAALPELRRFCEARFSDPGAAASLLNGLAVLGAMKTDAVREVLLTALGHPQDTVRIEAVRGLAVHAAPEDYDRIAALIPISTPTALTEIGAALAHADRARAEDQYVAWLAEPREPASLWIGAAERFCDTDRPEILARFRELAPRLQGEDQAYLMAGLARHGDDAALGVLRSALAEGERDQRLAAARALERVGLTSEITSLLASDRDEGVRGLAARAIAQLPRSPATDALLRKGTLDRAPSVRLACLRTLADRGDPEAFDQAMTMLEGSRNELEQALQVLRSPWEKDKELAARGFALLDGLRSGAIQPVRVQPATLDRAIAQVPLVEAARALYDRGRTTPGEIDSIPAHRWYLLQAGNTGPEGRAWLRERWAEELDPGWRIDIVAASAYEKDEASRTFLLEVLDDERTTPLELLHAANLLAHHGPTATIAPRLKRAALRVADPRVRPALNCLLNQWYAIEG